MEYKIKELKDGIKLHLIKTDLFKTNLSCILFTVPIKKETVTLNALIPFLLKRGTAKLKTQYEINKLLESLYGSTYDCGIDKSGDNQIIKFYMEGINDKYLPQNENLLKSNLDLLFEIVLNPLLEDGKFKSEFLDIEKQNLENVINGKIDDKDFFAFNDCIEKMYNNEGYGLYKYGYIEDLREIDLDKVSKQYEKLVNSAKIDIFISGDFEYQEVENIVLENENIKKLGDRIENYIVDNPINDIKNVPEQINIINEKMNVTQGKLILGLNLVSNDNNFKYIGLVYNAILGESATSKLFQNVREKAGLAYSARSSIIRQKKNIFIRCGIEIQNYDKAVDIIKVQLEDMRNGNFSDEDITNAKRYLISGIKTIETEQSSGIVYYIGQEMAKTNEGLNEYIDKIERVTKEEIVDFANKVYIDTIYFLSNK